MKREALKRAALKRAALNYYKHIEPLTQSKRRKHKTYYLLAKPHIYSRIGNIIKKSCKILTYMHFRINFFVILRSI